MHAAADPFDMMMRLKLILWVIYFMLILEDFQDERVLGLLIVITPVVAYV